MDACDGSVIGCRRFCSRVSPLLNTQVERLAREQPACRQTIWSLCSRWIGTNEATPP
jgi:hypothetical protein